MSAREGTWNQGGGIELPCRYELSILRLKRDKKRDLKNAWVSWNQRNIS